MELKLFTTIERKYGWLERPIYEIYNIWWKICIFYKYFIEHKWRRFYIKQNNFNLESPLEKELAKIYSFYEVLNKIEEPNKDGILFSITQNNNLIDLEWDDMQEDYYSIYNIIDDDYNIDNQYIEYWYLLSSYLRPELKRNEEKTWKLRYNEFYLLMQIYFWLYREEELKKQLEEKEKNWKYEEIKKELKWRFRKERLNSDYFDFENNYLSQLKVQEYLKLELMRKDTTWAFEWLEIEKIYDKDWSEEKQKKCIDEVNKEFWEEVFVEE